MWHINTRFIVKFLGGQEVLKSRVRTWDDLRLLARKGLPSRSFRLLQNQVAIPQERLAKALGIPLRTIIRRQGEARLTPTESEKVIRLAGLFALALDVFLGDQKKAVQWFQRNNRSLGGEIPLNLLDLEMGARQVEDALGRIQQGVFG